jgi:hypothetical protein
VGVVRREERVETGLGLVPCEVAVGLGDVAWALGVDLQLGLPEVSRLEHTVEGFPLGPEHIAAGLVKGPERLWAAAHRDVCGGGGCEVR